MAKTKIPGEYLKDSVVRFTAKAGENITKGQAVYISGISGETPVVSLADANDTNKMPAFGLAESTVSTNASVEVTSNGTLAGIDTSSYALGDILYISTTAGSLTNDPSGLEASKVQNIGMVQRVHASNGSIKVGGAGRTNATPNLNDGNIFVGNSSNKSVADSFTDVLNDQAGINSSANATAITIDSSERVGIGVTPKAYHSDYKAIDINNSASVMGYTGNNGAWLMENLYYDGNWKHKNSDFSALVEMYDGVFNFYNTVSGTAGATATLQNRLKIDQSGNVGIGTDSITNALDINGSQVLLANGALKFADAGNAHIGMIKNSGSSGTGQLEFYTGSAPTERMRITNDGNVLIGGTSATFGVLGVESSSNCNVDFFSNSGSSTAAKTELFFSGGISGNSHVSLASIVAQQASGDEATRKGELRFLTANSGGPSTKMIIKADGNVGIGTTSDIATSSSSSSTGFWFSSSDYLAVARNQQRAAIFNRIGNDGEVVAIRKDGTTVGSIGANSNDIYIASTGTYSCGLMFEGSSGASDIRPCNSSGALVDDQIDLGDTTTRFHNLYLSGGVHLGGTGTANELDDYEEGTFDPTLTPDSGSVTMYTSYNTLAYTKVGRVVTITGQLALTSVSSPSGEIVFGNLPFAMASMTNKAGQTRPSIHIYASGSNAPTQNHYFPAFIAFNEGGTTGLMIATFASSSDTSIANWLDAGSDIFANFSYITD